MTRLLPIALVGLVLAAAMTGRSVHSQIGIEYSPESLQAYILGLGLMAPPIFVAIVTFRQFLLLPSMLVLTVGGLVFGAVEGTALGGIGIALSASLVFAFSRGVGRGWIRGSLKSRLRRIEERIGAAGPAVVVLTTAHPMGPMSPFHCAAGVSSIRWYRFLLAITLAGFFRAFVYSFFGSTLLEVGSREFYTASALLLSAALLPLLNRRLRERVLGRWPPRAQAADGRDSSVGTAAP